MKRKIALACIILVALSVLGIFYTVSGGFSFLREEGSENKSLSIRLATQQASYALREPVKVNVYIVNFNNETMRFHGGVLSYLANISDSNGEFVVALITAYTSAPEYYLDVPPQSEVLGDTVEWNQLSASPDSSNSSKSAYKYVDPGIYTIRVTVKTVYGPFTSDARVEIKG